MHYDEICKRSVRYSTGNYKVNFKFGDVDKGDQVLIVNAEKVRFRKKELKER